MADSFDMSSLSSLLDPESLGQIKGLLAQFGVSEDEKKQARLQAILTAGLGLMGTQRGREWEGLGKAGLLGAQSYNTDIKAAQDQRGKNLTQAVQLMPLLQDLQWQKQMAGAKPSSVQMGPPDPNGQMQTQPAQSGAGFSFGAGPTGNMTIDYLRSLGVPDVVIANTPRKDLMKIAADYAKPENLRAGGSLVTRDESGNPKLAITSPILGPGVRMNEGQAEMIPGYLDTQTNITQKHEAAKKTAELSLEPPAARVTPSGEQYVPSGSALDQRYPSGPLPYGVARPFPPARQPSAAEMSNMRAMDQSGQGFDWTAANGLQPRGNVTKIGPGIDKELQARGDALAEQGKEIDLRAQASQAAYGRSQEMRSLIGQFTPGAAAPFRRSVASWAEAAGAPAAIVSGIAGGDLAAMQALQKQVVNAAFESTKQLTTRPAQAEVIMSATKGTANEAMTKPAITAILDYNDGVHHYLTDMQTAKDAWIADPKNGGSLAGFQAAWNKAHPLDAYIPSVEQLQQTFKGMVAPKPTAAASGNASVSFILRSNPTPDVLETLRRKGYIQ